MKIDLHVHTNYSKDGVVYPRDLILQAKENGINIIGITDHACLNAIPIAIKYAQKIRMTLVPGVEYSTRINNSEIHILGYGIDYRKKCLNKMEKLIKQYRKWNLSMTSDMLLRHKINIKAFQKPFDSRKDIAEILVENAIVDNLKEAFEVYLDNDEYKAMPIKWIEPQDIIQTINNAGGKAVLAHPFSISENIKMIDNIVEKLVYYGLQGMESYYASYSYEQQITLAKSADEFKIYKTSGSDFHGYGTGCRRELGSYKQLEEHKLETMKFIESLKKIYKF